MKTNYTIPWIRVIIAILGTIIVFILAKILTGKFIPTDESDILIFQNALLLIVLGSSIVEYKFITPSEAIVNSLFAIISLFSVYSEAIFSWWISVFIFCLVVFISSVICIITYSYSGDRKIIKGINELSFRISKLFGKSRIIFSIVFLYGLISFYSIKSPLFLTLTLFWGLFIVIWPLKIPEFISSLIKGSIKYKMISERASVDHPNIVRAVIESYEDWKRNNIKVLIGYDQKQHYVIPLYAQLKDNKILATGIISGLAKDENISGKIGELFNSEIYKQASEEDIVNLLGGDAESSIIGFVVENSITNTIRIEVTNSNLCSIGVLVWCWINDIKVFYQITEGITWEETLESKKHGFQIAEAKQLGTLDADLGFQKYEWLPLMNTPVFVVEKSFGEGYMKQMKNDFSYGVVPRSKLDVLGNIADNMEFHTAILGVTGSGKTELAYDIIKNVLRNGVKVICIDLTNKYADRLIDLKPEKLSIESDTIEELSEKIFNVDSGQYGAGPEKKLLKEFSEKLKDDVEKILTEFIESDKKQIGIISLEEISNTKATLAITEIYLSLIFNKAKYSEDKFPRLMVVVEEAHTVMPETSTMGLGDFDSKGLVGKITQIALQGRKYGIGLLVLSQRTATVSKSVLTQCNTVISFSCFDDTSLNFLKNIIGTDYVNLIPNMKFLQAMIFGKSVRSEKPIIVNIPYSEEKDKRII